MKKLFFITLLIAFLAKPVYNLSYLVYYQANLDYIIENFCVNKEKVEMACNGKCHLAKQLQQDSNQQDENGKALKLFTELFSVVFYQKQNDFISNAVLINSKTLLNAHYLNTYSYRFNSNLLKPPMA